MKPVRSEAAVQAANIKSTINRLAYALARASFSAHRARLHQQARELYAKGFAGEALAAELERIAQSSAAPTRRCA